MTQHYRDENNRVYGYKPNDIEVFEISLEDARELLTTPQTTEQRIAEIESRLTELDALSLRPLRAIAAGSAEQYDHDKLAELDAESETLRAELRGLLP